MAPDIDTSANCYSFTVNNWICPAYFTNFRTEIIDSTVEHLWITLVSVGFGVVLAFPLALLARRSRLAASVVLSSSTVIYTVPSLALFSLMLVPPFPGISPWSVVIGLSLYSLTILVRNILAGLQAVPADVREAAEGLGYGPAKLLLRIETPLALPVMMAGLRVATVSTVALVTIGSILNYGGLGNLLADGVQRNFKAEILTASVLCVLLAVLLDLLLLGVQRVLTPWQRARA